MPRKRKKDNEQNNLENNDIKKLDKRVSAIDKNDVKLGSEKIKIREKRIRALRLALLIITLFLIIIYFLLRLFYNGGAFTVELSEELARQGGIIMYENSSTKEERKILKAEREETVDNISINWLPENINNLGEGSHNGDNYIAYTFFIENLGSDPINYWYTILVDAVTRNVDEAIRVMVFRNDEKVVYAKANKTTGEAEKGTEKFKNSTTVVEKQRTLFSPGDVDKFTVVIWIEGDDPDCLDPLIGGEMKMHMDITEEHITNNNEQQESQLSFEGE